MATAEDIFYLYERNSTHYSNCSKNGKKDVCPTYNFDECFCCFSEPVNPITIGCSSVPCSLKRKCYIKQYEECPICMEKISRKCDAYLTSCGHSFHKQCIFKTAEEKWIKKYASQIRCPICRTSLGIDIHNINSRYNSIPGSLDDLENFWIRKDYIIPEICDTHWNHYLGLNKNCNTCLEYRKKGKKIYC